MATVSELQDEARATSNALMIQADAFLTGLLAITSIGFSDGFNIDSLIPTSYNYASVPQVFVPLAEKTHPYLYAELCKACARAETALV